MVALALLVAAATGLAWWQQTRDERSAATAGPAPAATPELLARGAYVARLGHCEGCHTARGGPPFAGGRAIPTPFGPVLAGNLTPDDDTGLGRWTYAQFRRALKAGRGADGRLLVPAFPYLYFTRLTEEDIAALWTWLRSLPPVRQAPAAAPGLPGLVGSQGALALWRALYFRPGELPPAPSQSAAWQRGRYLVEGPGHCGACHAARNLLGGPATVGASVALEGSLLPDGRWWAPALGPLPPERLAARRQLLQQGRTDHGNALGPMAEVVMRSTQHWQPADLDAALAYLQSLPAPAAAAAGAAEPVPAAQLEAGATLYRERCADCHGAQGQGRSPAYPALAGNRLLADAMPHNLLRVLDEGGFAPVTAGNPRPYGMPPQALDDAEAAALMTWLRRQWGHAAPAVSTAQVKRLRQ
jgi:mono/diheme cytochrome c family protein